MAISYAFRRAVEQAVARFFAGTTGHRHDGTDGQGPLLATWQPWTPTVTQGGSVACTVTEARYCLIGKVCHCYAHLAITGAGTIDNVIRVANLPVAATPAYIGGDEVPIGVGHVLDAGTKRYPVLAYADSEGIRFQWPADGSYLGTDNAKFALASGDRIGVTATYRVA